MRNALFEKKCAYKLQINTFTKKGCLKIADQIANHYISKKYTYKWDQNHEIAKQKVRLYI